MEEAKNAVSQLRATQDRVIKKMMMTAKDAKLPGETRRGAILVLGTIRDKRAIEFLVRNMSLKIVNPIQGTAEDRALEYPCQCALAAR